MIFKDINKKELELNKDRVIEFIGACSAIRILFVNNPDEDVIEISDFDWCIISAVRNRPFIGVSLSNKDNYIFHIKEIIDTYEKGEIQ